MCIPLLFFLHLFCSTVVRKHVDVYCDLRYLWYFCAINGNKGIYLKGIFMSKNRGHFFIIAIMKEFLILN